jgi:hypothetical protein
MRTSSRSSRSGQSSPARELTQAVPSILFSSLKSAPDVAIPRQADGPPKVAIPQEGAGAHQWAIPRHSARRPPAAPRAGKLKLTQSGGEARKSWTIRTSRQSGEAVRVRRSDAGFAVSLRFRDGSDELREPYLCYLTASEWSEARQGSIEQMARLVSEKMRRRKEAPELTELISRLEASAMNGTGRRNTR